MTIGSISNGESGSSVRGKLNSLVGAVQVSLTADTDIAAGTGACVSASGGAQQTWGPTPNIAGVVTVASGIPISAIAPQTSYLGLLGAVLSPTACLLVTANGHFATQIIPATISGTTLTPGTADTDIASRLATDLIPLDSTNFISLYIDTDLGGVYAAVGAISGGVISYGTPELLAVDSFGDTFKGCKLTSSLAIVSYKDNSGNPVVQALSVSGTTITAGTPQNVGTSTTSAKCVRLSDTSFAAAFSDGTIQTIVGTVSGTDITLGSAADTAIDGTSKFGVIAFDATHIAIATNAPTKAVAASISGTALSLGTVVDLGIAVSFSAQTTTNYLLMEPLDATHFSLLLNGAAPFVGTLSGGNSLALTSPVSIPLQVPMALDETSPLNASNDLVHMSLTVQDANHFMVSDMLGDIYSVKTSGGAIDLTSPRFGHRDTWYYQIFAIDSTRVLTSFFTWDGRHQARVIEANDPAASTPIGISVAGASASDPVAIQTAGVVEGLSGLTPGVRYYWNGDGTLLTKDNGRKAGVALSATSLLLS